jgi:hypothetical protein
LPLGAQPSEQRLDSARIDTTQKERGVWIWVNGSLFVGIGYDIRSVDGAIPLGAEAGISVAFQRSIINVQARGMVSVVGRGRYGGGRSVIEPISATYGWTERTDWSCSSTSLGLSWVYSSVSASYYGTIGIIGEIQALAKTNGIGIGLRLRGNLNLDVPYITVGVVIHLGWMP